MSFTFLEIKSGRLWYQGKRRKGEKERHRLGAYRWFCYITICHVWFNRTRTHMMPTKTNIAEYTCLHRAEPNAFCAQGLETTIIWVFWRNKLLKRLIRCYKVDFQWIMTQISAYLSHKTTAWTQNIKHELCRPFLSYVYGVFCHFGPWQPHSSFTSTVWKRDFRIFFKFTFLFHRRKWYGFEKKQGE